MMESICLVVLHLLCSWTLSTLPYSGSSNPPMFGDYEAQRHWMELTANIPLNEVYTNSSLNDLNYWGIDYPPLTVYHSYLLGHIQKLANPNWVELFTSRGMESYKHKFFMRCSVIASCITTFIPAAILTSAHLSSNGKNSKGKARRNEPKRIFILSMLLINPGLMLTDNAHFQYNSTSLGLFLFSVFCFYRCKYYMGSIFFCLALNYKQMELYHALPIFCFLLSRSVQKRSILCSVVEVAILGMVVIATFGVIWLPYIQKLELTKQVLTRLFPMDRGLFEDKVANFWCTLNNVLKVKEFFTQDQLAVTSAVITLVASLPSCLLVLFQPIRKNLSMALTSTSLAFFLFSYQVHEKSILLFTVPLGLLSGQLDSHFIIHGLSVSSLSMSHLYMKDGFLFSSLVFNLFFTLLGHQLIPVSETNERKKPKYLNSAVIVSWVGFLIIILLMAKAPAPKTLPHLYIVLLCAYSFGHFFLFFMYTVYHSVRMFGNSVPVTGVNTSKKNK